MEIIVLPMATTITQKNRERMTYLMERRPMSVYCSIRKFLP